MVSHVPLTLKYRPRQWRDLVGQEVMVKTITNMLKDNQLSQSLIFGGSRGVGKTTAARVLARALNCKDVDKVTYEPCSVCKVCTDITDDRSLEVQELDAASNGLVDDVRRIKEEVRYANVSETNRVYILDEAHGLSDKAWQAFLKMLEEPPPNTYFIFCTTETHKIPETIISRSIDFSFARMTNHHLVSRLQFITNKEQISVADGVLLAIARHVNGGMRDAISLLEQLHSYASGQPINLDHVSYVMGSVNNELLFKLFNACFKADLAETYRLLQEAYSEISDVNTLITDLLMFYRELLHTKIGIVIPDIQADHLQKLKQCAQLISVEYIIQCQNELSFISDQLRRTQLPGRSVVDIYIPKLFFGGMRSSEVVMTSAPVHNQTIALSPEDVAAQLSASFLQM